MILLMPRAATTSDSFNAIAEPRRRDILDYLAPRERPVGDIVTALGLAHLASLGLPEVELYVDGDNQAAIRTYTGLGFASIMVDVMYSLAVQSGLSG